MSEISTLSEPSLDDDVVGIVARAINPHAWDEDYQGYWPTRAPLDQDYARHQAKEAIKAYLDATLSLRPHLGPDLSFCDLC